METPNCFLINDDLRKEFEKVCESLGTNAHTELVSFMETVIRNHKIPNEVEKTHKETIEEGKRIFYEIRRQAKENGTMGMSLEEINEEIRKARYGED